MTLKKIKYFLVFLLFALRPALNAKDIYPFKKDSGVNIAKSPDYNQIVIFTPTSGYYEDGANHILYSGYHVYDLKNKLIIKISSSMHVPVNLRMPDESYIIKSNINELPAFQITVGKCYPRKFIIP